jgi:ATP phosphoribosyltransferase regulatory subunit
MNTPRFADNPLLPVGLHDDLPERAHQRAAAVEALLAVFCAHGYRLVNPPLLEFSPGNSPVLLQVMDGQSGAMLAVRPDMTPPVARIATRRLSQEPRPLRLCYAGEVVRAAGTMLRPDRQFTQVGLELVGSTAPSSEVEAILLAVKGLRRTGLQDITIDVCVPPLVPALLAEQGLTDAQEEQAHQALQAKDSAALASLPTAVQARLQPLLAHNGTLSVACAALSSLAWPPETLTFWEELQALSALLQPLALEGVRFTLDLTEYAAFPYHTGVAFSVFMTGMMGEVGRGGRYQAGASKESAVGFSLYVDSLLPLLSPVPQRPLLLIPFSMPLALQETLATEWRLLFWHGDGILDAVCAAQWGAQAFWDMAFGRLERI